MSDINIFYSTPSCYLKAIYLYGKRDKALNTEKGDHLPYGSDANTYWTGFYTSRPSLKYLAKRAHVFLQVVKQLSVLSRMGDSYELHLLRHAVSLVLHHDAITGTSQEHVANDFIRILSEAIEACSKKVSHFLSVLTPSWGGSRRPKNNQQFIICHQLNISQCRFSETQDTILLIVYNPLSIKTYHHVRLPAIALHYSIRDFNDEEVEYQLVPLPTAIINLPGRASTAIQELCFEAENIPPLGFTAYYISTIRDQLAENQFAKKSQTETEQELVTSISNEYIKVTINQTTGLLESIQNVDGVKIMVSQNWYFYSQTQNIQNSGAYSFRPGQERPLPITDKVSYHTIRGSLIKEMRQRFSDWLTQIIRLYRGEEFVEFEWVVGPVPIGTDLGKEVVTIFKTNISNNGIFYTDSNGRQMMRRTCVNESAGGTKKRSLPSCQYPVGKICIQDTKDGICVMTDRSQAATSYNEGEIELMVHRRLLTDDGFGLEESLNEEAFGIGLVIKGKHRIFIGNHKQEVDDLSFFERATQISRRWTFEPWLFMTQGEKTRRKWQNIRNKRYTGIRLHGLPRHIHILTLEPWKGGTVLLRLENTLENFHGPNIDINLANPAHITVDLRKIFLFVIRRVEETTLAANQWLQHARQMDWSTRYVYSGGDDGILPEDNPDYIDEFKMNQDKEPEQYSEEYPGRKSNQRTQNKFKENRRKRSTNITNIVTQNVTDRQNTTYERISKKTNRKSETKMPRFSFVGSSQEFRDSPTKKRRNRKNRTLVAYDESDDDGVTKSIYEMYYKVKPKQKLYIRSSEELTEDLRNRRMNHESYRTYRKYNKNDDNDEVISRRKQSSEEFTTFRRQKNRRMKDLYEVTPRSRMYNLEEYTTRRSRQKEDLYMRRRSKDVETPFSVTERLERDNRRRRNKEVYRDRRGFYAREDVPRDSKYRKRRREELEISQEEELSSPEEEIEVEEDKYLERRKRSISEQAEQGEQSSEQPELDYIVTLRPTQIRTFIIWFEEKKPYTL